METTCHGARSSQTRLKSAGRRCSVSERLRERLGVEGGRHVRAEHDGKGAYYVVDQVHENDGCPFRTARKGRERLDLDPGDPVRLSPTVPRDGYLAARRTGGFAETVWDDGRQDRLRCYSYGSEPYDDYDGDVSTLVSVGLWGENSWWNGEWNGNEYLDRVNGTVMGDGWASASAEFREGVGNY